MGQLKMLDGYFMSELTAARIASMVVMSIENADDDGDGLAGDGINADGSKAIDIGSGTALELGPGQHLNDHTPSHPSTAFDSFMKQCGRMISSGLNVPYHDLFSDLSGVNFSSARIGEMAVREFWKELQSIFIDDMLEPIYEAWQKSAQMNGALDVPFDLERYIGDSLKWEPKRWPWVDPLKDVQATTLEIQNGFITHEAEAASRGRDWREDYDQLKVEQDYADSLGIQLGTDIRGQGTSEVNNQELAADDDAPAGDAPNDPAQPDDQPAKPAGKPGGKTAKPAKPSARPSAAPAKAKVKTPSN
jgi:lambda family phage portal protein